MKAVWALIRRDVSLAFQTGSGIAVGMIFYLCLVILFPFGVGPNLKTLGLISPAIIWAGPLLAVLLGAEKLFQPDMDDGTFDLYRLSHLPMEAIVLAKAVAFWLAYIVPLIIVSPVFAMMVGMEGPVIIGSVISLLLGSPALIFIGTFCAALTARLKRAGLLVVILAIPFLVPTLIFGVTATRSFGDDITAPASSLYMLAALSLFSVLPGIAASARILRS